MSSISVSELKAHLSESLRRVQEGEPLLVTDRGRPIARVVPVESMSSESVLDELERSGLARIGSGKLPRGFWAAPRPADPQGTVRAAADAERQEGF